MDQLRRFVDMLLDSIGQSWPWTMRKGYELPEEYRRYMSDPELNGDALGGRLHWVTVAEPVLTFLGALLIGILMLLNMPAGAGSLATLIVLVLIALFVRMAFMLWEWNYNLLFITGKRVLNVHGLFTRTVDSLVLSKLTDITYKRTFPGLLLNYGSFRLETAGQNQAVEGLRYIPDPVDSYRHIMNLIFGRGTTDVIITDFKVNAAGKKTRFVTRPKRDTWGEERFETTLEHGEE